MTTMTATRTERCINCGDEIVSPTPQRAESSRLYYHRTNDMSIACFTALGADGKPTVAKLAGAAELFFFDNAGHSWNPATETEEEGTMRCARDLAAAERFAKAHGWEVRWSDDWSIDHQKEFDCYDEGGPETCEMALLVDQEGTILGSLRCIDGATDEYRRVVEAELADEALGELKDQAFLFLLGLYAAQGMLF